MMFRAGTKTLTPWVALVSLTLLMGQSLDTGSPSVAPSADEATPAVDTLPTAVNPEVPSATAPAPEPPAHQVNKAAAAPTTPKKEKAAKSAKTEVLPWANTPIAPPAVDTEANASATAQCAGLFEAMCRETPTCAWIGDVQQEGGATLSARCVGRPAAPPKKTAKTKPKPKPEATTAAVAPAGAQAAAPASKPITVSPPGAAPAIVVTTPGQ